MRDPLSTQQPLRDLIDRAWQVYHAHAHHDWIVSPALPILFFGDLERFIHSPIKIVTAALNPSRLEFPSTDRFRRFPAAAEQHTDSRAHQAAYLRALSAYFRHDPYTNWFNCFEPLLNGLDASYYPGRALTALQTDLCSPLATDPTWNGLTRQQQQLLMADGVSLWHRLIEYLAPDLIIMSLARQHLAHLAFDPAGEWRTIATVTQRKDGVPMRRPYHVHMQPIRVGSRTIPLIFAPAAHKPLGLIPDATKHLIGQRINQLLHTRDKNAPIQNMELVCQPS